MRLAYAAFAALLVASSPAAAQIQFTVQGETSPRMASDPVPPNIAFSLYKKRMIALRSEARELARQDGGTLSNENREMIQRRIDVTERVFHRRVRDFNPHAYLQLASAQP